MFFGATRLPCEQPGEAHLGPWELITGKHAATDCGEAARPLPHPRGRQAAAPSAPRGSLAAHPRQVLVRARNAFQLEMPPPPYLPSGNLGSAGMAERWRGGRSWDFRGREALVLAA